MIKQVCVYCASSTKIDSAYLQSAFEVGQILTQNSISVVYGGGSVGSMGALANAVIQNNGNLIGVIPKFMMELEWGNPQVTEMKIVETMAQRKQLFIENVDAVIALPGGTGTLEELSEVISLKKLGIFDKPIIILNTKGFYNNLILFFEQMVVDNFIRIEHKELYSIVDSPEEIINAINNAPKWDDRAKNMAAF
jgi:uncharacterized protein (TIGR00730 family)